MKPQTLYRFFDVAGNLLYVGITNTWYQRFHEHEKKSGWFADVSYVTFEGHETRESVRAAEIQAIKTENPCFNLADNPAYETKMDHFAKLKTWLYKSIPTDELHKELIEAMKKFAATKGLYKVSKRSKWVAMAFISAYYDIGPSGKINCRNCDAMANDGNINGWANQAYEDWDGIYATH
jgi:hypothetical protein